MLWAGRQKTSPQILPKLCETFIMSCNTCKLFVNPRKIPETEQFVWRFPRCNFCLSFCRCLWLLPKALRNGALGAFSLLFFAWAGLKGAAILLALAAITWLGGLLLEKLPRKKPLLILLIAAHLAVLAAFKYAGFAARSINALVPDLLPVFAPALPLGISFYVFTAIGYLADVSCGKVAAARSPFRFFVFLAFFGHGPSGPIVRYDQQLPCLDAKAAERQVSLDRFCYGIKRFVLGLAKKAIIADQLALIYSRVTSVPAATVPAPALVLGYLAYMMQLYFDFSGYSDMAIGIGSFFGLELPENFNYPYLSCSVGEYWRRWHMSLSGWFRDYVYIPLGGSRCSLAKNCRNLLIVFLLTGLWHGAAWQYVAFGLLHGVLLCLERLGLRKFLQCIPPFFAHAYTLVVLWFTLIIFGAHGLAVHIDDAAVGLAGEERLAHKRHDNRVDQTADQQQYQGHQNRRSERFDHFHVRFPPVTLPCRGRASSAGAR